MNFSIKPRFGNVSPFISLRTVDSGHTQLLSAGVTTYSDTAAGEAHCTTSIDVGGRSDHLSNLMQRFKTDEAATA